MAFANFDRRRINGPEESFPPFYEDEPFITLPSHPVVRSGRSANEIRPICAMATPLETSIQAHLVEASLATRPRQSGKWVSIHRD